MKREEEYRGKHAGAYAPESRPPWMTHPKKRKMPMFARKLLIAAIILAVAALGLYLYLLLNPDVMRNATIS